MSFLAPKSAISHPSPSPRKQSLRGSSTSLQSNDIQKQLDRSEFLYIKEKKCYLEQGHLFRGIDNCSGLA